MKWHMRFRGYMRIDNKSLPCYHIHTDANIGFIVIRDGTLIHINVVPELLNWFIYSPDDMIPFVTLKCEDFPDIEANIGLMFEELKVESCGVYDFHGCKIIVETKYAQENRSIRDRRRWPFTIVRVYQNNEERSLGVIPYDQDCMNTIMTACKNDERVSIKENCYHCKYRLTDSFDFESKMGKTELLTEEVSIR